MVIVDFIIKVASRCNLNCSYCYMYNMGDTTYLNQPKFMSLDIVTELAKKLKRHCDTNGTEELYLAFHGGEPMLVGMDFYRNAVKIFNRELKGIDVAFVIQTNGTLLDDQWCELFAELNIQVGISIDGPERFQNKFRLYHNQSGSYNDVVRGIQIRNKHSIGGLISVINTEIAPSEFYEFLLNQQTITVNLLLPNNHYDNLPPGKTKPGSMEDTVYGDWLIKLYDIWSNDESVTRPRIPYLESIIGLILGQNKGDELIGKRKNGAVTIETNGDIEIVDPLRICGNGFTRNNLNILTHEISAIESFPLFQLYYNSHDRLCDKCQNCAIQNVCGGGYLGHRFSSINEFDNPSIYCTDLIKLITHIQTDIVKRLPINVIDQLNLEVASANDVYQPV